MTAAKSKCIICGHLMSLHYGGVCSTQRCNCKKPGFTPEQAKVLGQK